MNSRCQVLVDLPPKDSVVGLACFRQRGHEASFFGRWPRIGYLSLQAHEQVHSRCVL